MDVLGLYLIIALVLATLAAWIADRRGRDFWVYFVFTILIPGTALISIPYLLIFARRREHEDLPDDDDRISRLERLVELRDRGALTPEEFEAEKAQL